MLHAFGLQKSEEFVEQLNDCYVLRRFCLMELLNPTKNWVWVVIYN